MVPKFDLQSILSAKTEWQFWAAFEAAHLDVSAWPNGLLLLWTPTAPYLALFGDRAHTRELMEMQDESLLTYSPISPSRLGDIRRDVRRGSWALSVRDTNRAWTSVHDNRLCDGGHFSDPMLPSAELGLALVGNSARQGVFA